MKSETNDAMKQQSIVRTFIVENFLFGDDENLRDDASLIDQGIIDSTGVLELVVFLEETFGIKIQDDELIPENLESIARICAYIEGKAEYGHPKDTGVPVSL